MSDTHHWGDFMNLPPESADPERARAHVLPAPFEQTSSYSEGSKNGPAALLEASHQVEFFDAALGFEPFEQVDGIATWPALAPEPGEDGARYNERLYAWLLPKLTGDRLWATLGGEHTSVIGAIRAHCEFWGDITVVQFDAHSDLRPEYEGSPWNHACAMARVLDFNDSLVQVGIRSQEKAEREFAASQRIPVFHAHEIHNAEFRGDDWIADVIAASRTNVYVTFDCDAFDPAVIPATGTPEPGGLTWQQVDRCLRRLAAARTIVGFDVNELAPIPGLHHPQFTAAKFVYRMIGHCAANW